MKERSTSKRDELAVVYVMKNRCDDSEVRVGHHTTSDKQREHQVSRGKGEKWEVVFSRRLGSKLTATAVEHVAHALLEQYIHKRKRRRVWAPSNCLPLFVH